MATTPILTRDQVAVQVKMPDNAHPGHIVIISHEKYCLKMIVGSKMKTLACLSEGKHAIKSDATDCPAYVFTSMFLPQ